MVRGGGEQGEKRSWLALSSGIKSFHTRFCILKAGGEARILQKLDRNNTREVETFTPGGKWGEGCFSLENFSINCEATGKI